ncbi:MAG TPA: dsRBD fold-containing protein [Acidimicrobiales bacterium]|nr:dsRBD fold-containing protein [Acidimicrobiales bacterium]
MIETSEIEITFTEDGDHTEARASLLLRGATFTGWGRARRNPADPDVPMVGEELAAARALSELAHALVEGAAQLISDREVGPARPET